MPKRLIKFEIQANRFLKGFLFRFSLDPLSTSFMIKTRLEKIQIFLMFVLLILIKFISFLTTIILMEVFGNIINIDQ